MSEGAKPVATEKQIATAVNHASSEATEKFAAQLMKELEGLCIKDGVIITPINGESMHTAMLLGKKKDDPIHLVIMRIEITSNPQTIATCLDAMDKAGVKPRWAKT